MMILLIFSNLLLEGLHVLSYLPYKEISQLKLVSKSLTQFMHSGIDRLFSLCNNVPNLFFCPSTIKWSGWVYGLTQVSILPQIHGYEPATRVTPPF